MGHEGEQRQQIKIYIYKKKSRKYIKNKSNECSLANCCWGKYSQYTDHIQYERFPCTLEHV